MVTSARGHHRPFRSSSALRTALRNFTDRNCAGCEGEYAAPMSRGRRRALDGGALVPRQAIEHSTFFCCGALRLPGRFRALIHYVLLRREWPRIQWSHLQAEHSKSGCLPRNSWNARITRANLTLRTIPIHNHQGSGIRASLRYPEDAAEHETSPISPGRLQPREKAAYPRPSKLAGLPSRRRQVRKQ